MSADIQLAMAAHKPETNQLASLSNEAVEKDPHAVIVAKMNSLNKNGRNNLDAYQEIIKNYQVLVNVWPVSTQDIVRIKNVRNLLALHLQDRFKRAGKDINDLQDVKSFFTDKNIIQDDAEFFALAYLYVQVFYDTSDKNDIYQKTADCFRLKQMECDDATRFYDELARARGMELESLDMILDQNNLSRIDRLKLEPRARFHARFLWRSPTGYHLIDQQNYILTTDTSLKNIYLEHCKEFVKRARLLAEEKKQLYREGGHPETVNWDLQIDEESFFSDKRDAGLQ